MNGRVKNRSCDGFLALDELLHYRGEGVDISRDGEFVTVEGVRLHYVSEGRGTPVVLLHGNAGFTHDYSTVMTLLARRGFRALAFDRPGHGRSERANNGATTAGVQAKLIRRALLELEVEQPIMVGHSWGGLLILAYWLQYQTDTAGLVLLAPAIYPEGDEFTTSKALVGIPGLGYLLIRMSKPFINREIRRTLDRAFSPDEVPSAYLELATTVWNRPEQVRAIVEDEADFGLSAEGLTSRFGEIRAPTVIVTGDSDHLVKPEAHSFPLHKAIPHSRLVVLPGAGHMLPQTRPEAVLEAIETLSTDVR